MKVLMACAGGMSSSFVAEAIKKEAMAQGISNFEIEAIADSRIKEHLGKSSYDLVILAPQIKFQVPKITELAKGYNTPVLAIEGRLYTPMGAKTLLQQMKNAVETHNG